jgi:hypothetical protein
MPEDNTAPLRQFFDRGKRVGCALGVGEKKQSGQAHAGTCLIAMLRVERAGHLC